MQNATPMLRQYLEIKKRFPGTILFFRLGDFYEMFNDDAVIGARELEITLTARQKDSPNPIPMCGVPHHSAANYIARLVRKGYRVAICEQTEAAGKDVKLVKRDVVRVITPGTAIDPQLLEAKESVYLAAVCGAGESFGLALLELSTGEFLATEHRGAGAWERVCADVESFGARELIFPEALTRLVSGAFGGPTGEFAAPESERNLSSGSFRVTLTARDDWSFHLADCLSLLCNQFGTADLAGFGLSGRDDAIRAAGAALNYALETQKAAAAHIASVSFLEHQDFMVLDAVTLRNLEIVEARGDASRRTLLGVIDETVTGMGARLLRSWLLRPSIKRSEINTRLGAVRELTETMLRDNVRFLLRDVADLERLVGRLNLGTASPRDLLALNRSVGRTPSINEILADADSLLLRVLSENISELPEIRDLIDRAIADEPPLNIADGGVIRDGFNFELDELRQIATSAKQTIASFEEQERARTGISTLKVRFNNVFGYYIEVSKGSVARVPDDYERRQTLTNAERYTMPQLKEWEAKVLGAEERIAALELELFNEIRSVVRNETPRLQSTARALATLDALASLAETAVRRNYVCPTLHDGDEIEVRAGRHPIVEAYLPGEFVPNDVYLNNSTDRLLIITGPNMGGKSTILRQVGLIQILGQIGSFVPATSARLPIIDRVWTRVGASDDLSSGRSTFMVEMTETAAILHGATPRSLVILDEIGRGTSTFDGLSIAWAVAEFIHNSPHNSAKTMFATHYHELTELAENLPGAKNYQVMASERDGDVVFLHQLKKGKASKSYGIAVAKLAGLPVPVLERARAVLDKLEKYELAVFADTPTEGAAGVAAKRARSAKASAQLSLFAIANETVVDELRSLDPSSLSETELRELLKNLKNRII